MRENTKTGKEFKEKQFIPVKGSEIVDVYLIVVTGKSLIDSNYKVSEKQIVYLYLFHFV